MRTRWPLTALLLLLLVACAAEKPPASEAPYAPRSADSEFPGSGVAIDLPWVVVQGAGGLSAHNLESGKAVAIPVQGRQIVGFAVGGGKVVWSDLRHEPRDPAGKDAHGQPLQAVRLNWDVMLLDLASGEVRQLTADPAAQRYPATDGRYVVWEDFRDDHGFDPVGAPAIYLYDLQSGKERRITDAPGGQFRPRVGGGRVVYMDGRNNEAQGSKRACDNCPDNNWNVYSYEIGPQREWPVATRQYMEESPDVAGDRIVWIERLGYRNTAVVLLDLKRGKRLRLTDDTAEREHARVAGTRVVWSDARRTGDPAKGSDVCLYEAAAGKAYCLTNAGVQSDPVVSGNRVAWVQAVATGARVQVVTAP